MAGREGEVGGGRDHPVRDVPVLGEGVTGREGVVCGGRDRR